MNVIHLKEANSYEPETGWKRSSLCNESDISVEHFIKPPKHSSPLHEHPNSQVLIVLKGSLAIISKDGYELIAGEGDAVYIPKHEFHRVKNLLDEPSMGIDIFVPGRSFDFWLKR
jgi:quercetin dioxygenase-like cupin family protein